MPGEDLHPLMLQESEEVGAFRIVRRLATGGFGAIFLAESETRRQVALKFALQGPSEEDSPAADARTWKEVHVLMRLEHPNVVELLGYRRWPDARDGYLVLIMGYVEGPTLSEWALAAQPTPRRAVQVFQQLALTLDAIHRAGVLHRDIKGNNIIIRASDGQPVLVDFGSGDHACSPVLTEDTLPPGTPSYRSPEALRFWAQPRPAGSRYAFAPTDDLYSLGLVLYEVLTGSFPYPTQLPPAGLLASIESGGFPLPSVRNPRVPKALDAIVARLLSPSAAGRPPSGAALFDALDAALAGADSAWDEHLFPPLAPEEAVTEEALEFFDGDEEARELRHWMRVPERARPPASFAPPTEPASPWALTEVRASTGWRRWRDALKRLWATLRAWR
ncbi:serine/threonine protein kinase [Myxococcus xanthus]|uniref:serine/threonine-protein kinase n=1 Tax=Myxococcus xanthus TaxID=34 RepID=UPI0019175B5D|nr:serine/threonine-protein kinase [Myxococcus xanthus]QQR48506.1 serine/threonine protein kinase [Myxococcus xanthus]